MEIPKIHCFALLLSLIISLGGCGPIWKSPAYYTAYTEMDLERAIMTPEQYDEVFKTHPRPYVFQHGDSTGGVFFFGSEHTKNPQDPQIEQIRQAWKSFDPTVALVEGRMGFLFRWFMDPVETFGESGLVLELAQSKGIDCYTWEPPFEKEIEFQLRRFPAKRVALFYVIRPYASNLRHGKPENPEDFVEEYRSKRTKYSGLENTLASIATIDSMWKADFPGEKDWRETSDAYGYPGYLQKIFIQSNAFRDEHFARVIIDLLHKKHRVFAVAGSSHAVKLESALKAAIRP